MNKTLIIVLILAIAIVGGYLLLGGTGTKSVPGLAAEQLQANKNPGTPVGTQAQNTVVYTDSGYAPAILTIKKGKIVVWKNESSQTMWPASAMHPTHTVYSGTSLEEHCPDVAGTAFDACTGIQPGNSWSFTFAKTGTWHYHDHLNPGYIGTIVVE